VRLGTGILPVPHLRRVKPEKRFSLKAALPIGRGGSTLLSIQAYRKKRPRGTERKHLRISADQKLCAAEKEKIERQLNNPS